MFKLHRSLLTLLAIIAVSCLAVAGMAIAFQPAQPAHAATFMVNTAADTNDGGCTPTHCSLREAIEDSNNAPGPDTVTFDVDLAHSVFTVSNSVLELLDWSGTWIDGDTDDDGRPDVELRFGGGGTFGCLRVRSSNNRIEGLAIGGFPSYGIYLQGTNWVVTNNLILNSYIGTNMFGMQALTNTTYGIYVESGASGANDNVIQGNLVSGNGSQGIRIENAQRTLVISNVIGVNVSGTTALPNVGSGIGITGALTTTVQANLISGNNSNGIYIDGSQNTLILSNVIGLDVNGTAALGNQGTAGIFIYRDGITTTIRGNTISGNKNYGILLQSGTRGTLIAGNRIGTNVAGTAGLGNGATTDSDGIQIVNAADNTIGGSSGADRNIISANKRAGIFISGASSQNNVVQGNYIGTDGAGAADLGNGYSVVADGGHGGIYVQSGASNNRFEGNLVRYNYVGIRLSGSGSGQVPPQNNRILSNTVTSNDEYGIVSQVTHSNTVPYTTPLGGDNLIAYNVVTGTGVGCSPCSGLAIYNYGASPQVLTNTITGNKAFGIVNRVWFGVDGPTNAADDILSIPLIVGNTIDGNGNDGIQSRDTAPLNRYTLQADNTIGNNNGEPDISQRWFVAVEVLSGTQPITAGLTITVTGSGGKVACPAGASACAGSTQNGGAWGPASFQYGDVELSDGSTRWFEVLEYKVDVAGVWTTYTSHILQASGARFGYRLFAIDGVTTTAEVAGDVGLATCIPTGILSDPQHSFCRYQIPQITVSQSSGDDDGDGIPNSQEGTGDTDGDGTPDYRDDDSDGDGIPDATEGTGDTDGDGTPDYKDTDSDNDGIPDVTEGSGDTDGDGTPDYRDSDSDNDGIPDITEGTGDSDGDGTPDYKDTDSDNDGIADGVEGTGDSDGDGTPNYKDTDSDNDGQNDDVDTDDDNDGLTDVEEGLVDLPGTASDSSVDTDGDGKPDYLDTDSDNDTIPDSVEGFCPAGHGASCNADGDSQPDFRDTDSDNDTILDSAEYSASNPSDPLTGCTAGTAVCFNNDADGDGTSNYRDTDSDGDGAADRYESTSSTEPAPFGHTGVPAWLDPVYRTYLPSVLMRIP